MNLGFMRCAYLLGVLPKKLTKLYEQGLFMAHVDKKRGLVVKEDYFRYFKKNKQHLIK